MPEIYTKNYIKNTIFRIDYPSILKLTNENPSAFQEQIIELFPNIEVIEHLMRFSINANEEQETGEVKKIWRFKSRDESRILEISPEYLVVIENNYTDFTSFNRLLEQVLSPFRATYNFHYIKRVGLRYINEINIPEATATSESLSTYFSDSLVEHLDFASDKQLLRTSNVTEFIHEGARKVKFRYGLANENYPNQLQDSKFTLDFDCYNTDSIGKEALTAELAALNVIATEHFESCIKDAFREVLRQNT